MAAAGIGVTKLLASAFSSNLGTTVITHDHYKKEKERGAEDRYQALQIEDLFRLTQHHIGPTEVPESSLQSPAAGGGDDGFISLHVKDLTGNIFPVRVSPQHSVHQLKEALQERHGIPRDRQRLLYGGTVLQGGAPLCQCGLGSGCTVYMLYASPDKMFYIDESFLDPAYDYDFTNVRDGSTEFHRGGKRYYRPCGWERFALKVKGRYENDTWLGAPGYRTYSSPDEWPVSYHGTKKKAVKPITKDGYDQGKSERQLYGEGIYSSPRIEVAEDTRYAETFIYDGKKYQVVFQNRVSTEGMRVEEKAWHGKYDYWIQPNDRLIRPYGICIKLY